MEKIELVPIKIAVIAPTGAGKTALISTVCDYIKSNSNMADGYSLEIENRAAKELNQFKQHLLNQLAGRDLEFNLQMIEPTDQCTDYEFSMKFEDKQVGLTIKQPFVIKDIPGAFVNNRFMYENDTEYEEFINHLDSSRILWIPIDTPVMMECKNPKECSMSDAARCTANLEDFAREWAQYAAKNGRLDFCNFVLVKCETYFSQDTDNEYNGCKGRFDEAYGNVIDAIKNNNNEDTVSCVAVETIGPVRINQQVCKWNENGNFEAKYIVTGTKRQVKGVDCLLRDVFLIAKENVEYEVDIQKASKNEDKREKTLLMDRLIEQQKQNLADLDKRESDLKNETEELKNLEKELDSIGWGKSLLVKVKSTLAIVLSALGRETIAKRLEELKIKDKAQLQEAIRNKQAHRNSLKNEIESQKYKLRDLETIKSSVTNDIKMIEDTLTSLNKVKIWFSKLSGGSADSKYYRSL
ncbi:MAG: hypothetical protein IKO56_07730 [Alphaproteobacteria bacterium]|nr:hypothetical protein [Alphaproteobacteria bacterium]